MKIKMICLLFIGSVLSCVGANYIFPPFYKTDLAFGGAEIEERMTEGTSFYEKTFPELRSIMTFGSFTEQQKAAKALVRGGDRETILRVIYSLKQGHWLAEEILKQRPDRQVLPYLMEDVAHGSMEDFGGNLMHVSFGRVRFAATEIVASVLRSIEEFPEPTRQWLDYVGFGNGNEDINDLSQKSKFLVEWWILNEQAFLEERWNDVIPVPYAGSYPPRPKLEHTPADDGWVPPPVVEPPVPWKFKPLDVPESFEDWSARIIHPERRDLRWVKLTFENDKWVEHPPIRLDPLAPPTAPSRAVRRPAPPIASVEHDALSQWPVWIASLGGVAGLLFWFFRLSKTRSA
jgi:hypothetical protein